MLKLTTPFRDVLLPLSEEEEGALRTSIQAEGVRDPVLHTEDGRVLDGHHRLEIEPKAPRHCVPGSGGWSDAECMAYVIRCNWERRNLSPAQKAELREKQKAIAKALKKQDKKQFTDKAISRLLGVGTKTVNDWLLPKERGKRGGNNGGAAVIAPPEKSEKPDARVVLSKAQKAAAVKRVKNGESRAKVAAACGVSRRTIDTAVKAYDKKAAGEDARAAAAAEGRKSQGPRAVLHGDFREVAKGVPAGSVSLVFTDPPYDRKSLPLYGDLAAAAKRLLRPGGSLLCYCGHYLLPEVLALMTPHLDFYWCCACVHSGRLTHMREYGIKVGWKPILWFTNGSRPVSEKQESFLLDVASGGREKDAHDWQQAEAEAAYYIGKLTAPGETVFEPFSGGGTTAAAAAALGRVVVACDVDEAKCALGNRRVEKLREGAA